MHCRAPRWAHSTDPRHDVEQRGYDVIGATLKEWRLRAHLTQRQLEDLTGIDQTVISRLENGKQYGLRWSRYAILIAVLDRYRPDAAKVAPWWATLGKSPNPWLERLRAEGLPLPVGAEPPEDFDDEATPTSSVDARE